jgi:hypothetical protein
MVRNGRHGSVVTLICDDGNRYLNSYYNPQWLEDNGHQMHHGWSAIVASFLKVAGKSARLTAVTPTSAAAVTGSVC